MNKYEQLSPAVYDFIRDLLDEAGAQERFERLVNEIIEVRKYDR